jgi:hypothetical protein
MALQQIRRRSRPSSAQAALAGASTPNALAVLRLITSPDAVSTITTAA